MIKEEYRKSILQAASEIFNRFGYQKTTMDDIGRALRKGKSSIYYYFKNKEEIFQEVVESEVHKLRIRLFEAINAHEYPGDQLKGYILERMMGLKKFINLYSVLQTDYVGHLDFVNHMREKYDKEEIEMVKGILDQGVQKDVFRISDTYLTSVAIVTAMKGLEIPLFITHPAEDKLELRLESLMNVLFNGILK